jgi:hypothetical protein
MRQWTQNLCHNPAQLRAAALQYGAMPWTATFTPATATESACDTQEAITSSILDVIANNKTPSNGGRV